MATMHDDALVFPRPEPPPPGSIVEVAPGVLWFRLALPFALDHVNVYLIEDDGGWAVLDTGIGDQRTREAWEAAFAGKLRGARLTRVIATHFHPDHIGLVGWLAERFDLPLSMSRTEYFFAQVLHGNPGALHSPAHLAFYRENGLDPETTSALTSRGLAYLGMVTASPPRSHGWPQDRRSASAGGSSRLRPAAGTRPSRSCCIARPTGCSSRPTR